jgi:hypothetical protein
MRIDDTLPPNVINPVDSLLCVHRLRLFTQNVKRTSQLTTFASMSLHIFVFFLPFLTTLGGIAGQPAKLGWAQPVTRTPYRPAFIKGYISSCCSVEGSLSCMCPLTILSAYTYASGLLKEALQPRAHKFESFLMTRNIHA